MSEVVGATHEFHEAAYAEDWARRFIPTPERLHLFETILRQLESAVPADGHIVELGIGPAYLAEYLLERMPRISYEGVDFFAADAGTGSYASGTVWRSRTVSAG